MAERFTIIDSTLEQANVDFGDGKMHKYVVTLRRETGDVIENVQRWLPTNKEPLTEGTEIEADLGANKQGLKLQNVRILNPLSGSAPQAVSADQTADQTRDTSNDRNRSIERQVALKAGVELAAARGANAQTALTYAEEFDAFLRGAAQAAPKPAPDASVPQGSGGGDEVGVIADDDDIPF